MTRRRAAASDATWMMREGFAFGETHYPTQRSVTLELESRAAVVRFALGLALLDEGLAAAILLLGYKDSKLEILVGDEKLFKAHGAALEIALDTNTLGYVKVFVLTAVRDGLASVDHVDIDLRDVEPEAPAATLTLMIRQGARGNG